MKIAFIVDGFPVISDTFILNQITGLLDMGHDVRVFCRYISKEKKRHPEVEKYKLVDRTTCFGIPRNGLLRAVKALPLLASGFLKDPVKVLRSFNVLRYQKMAVSLRLLYCLTPFLDDSFDIIHCHFGPNGIVGAYIKDIGVKAKIITTFHGYDISKLVAKRGKDIYRRLFQLGDLFLPVSDYWKKKLEEFGCKSDKIVVHRMGIDLERFTFSERRLPSGGPVKILTVGRLVEKKGHRCAIEAVARLVKKGKNVEYIIVGSGKLREDLEGLVSELGVSSRVRFLGALSQDEVAKLYQDAHIFLLPSVTAKNGDQEGIPVVLMEAQAVGMPVVSTVHSGIPEVVIDGKSGFLVPERDVDTLANRLEYLVDHPEVWVKLGRCGRRIVEEKYDIKKLNKRLVEIYHDLLNGRLGCH